MKRIEVNAVTGEAQEVDLTPEEVAQAQAQYAAWEAAEAQRVAAPTLEQIIAQLQAEIAALKAK